MLIQIVGYLEEFQPSMNKFTIIFVNKTQVKKRNYNH